MLVLDAVCFLLCLALFLDFDAPVLPAEAPVAFGLAAVPTPPGPLPDMPLGICIPVSLPLPVALLGVFAPVVPADGAFCARDHGAHAKNISLLPTRQR